MILESRRMSSSYHGKLKIVSGGQTGVDRVALDFAIEHGLEHGGWCPRGRIAEDGVIDDRYLLRETESPAYAERTRRNVLDSDATLIFSGERPLTGGTRLTAELAEAEFKPLLIVFSDVPPHDASRKIRDFLAQESLRTLNIAGPRACDRTTGLLVYVRAVLECVLGNDPHGSR